MKLSYFAAGTLAAGLLLAAVPAHADWHTFWERSKKDFRRVNAWPAPFNFIDRDNVQAPYRAMIAKGWQRQQTLGSTYFDPEAHTLTLAGEQKVKAILTTSRPEHRTIYVVKAERPEDSESRMQSVSTTISRFAPEQPANVLPTSLEPRGWSAAYINTIDTKMRESIPTPALPTATTNTGG